MISGIGALTYSYLIPKLWDYFQANIINVANPAFGSLCFELTQSDEQQQQQQVETSSRKVQDITHLVLSSDKKKRPYVCSADKIPVTLLIELFLVCSIRKIVIQSDQFVPQRLVIQVSETGYSKSFRTVKELNNCMQKGKPLQIEFLPPYFNAKYIKIIVLKGRLKRTRDGKETSGSFSLTNIQVFGVPVLNPQNISQFLSNDAFSSVIQKVKQTFTGTGTHISEQQQQQQQQEQKEEREPGSPEYESDSFKKNENEPNQKIIKDGIIFEELSDEEDNEKSRSDHLPKEFAGQVIHKDRIAAEAPPFHDQKTFLFSKL
jgi:hypothetical protein